MLRSATAMGGGAEPGGFFWGGRQAAVGFFFAAGGLCGARAVAFRCGLVSVCGCLCGLGGRAVKPCGAGILCGFPAVVARVVALALRVQIRVVCGALVCGGFVVVPHAFPFGLLALRCAAPATTSTPRLAGLSGARRSRF